MEKPSNLRVGPGAQDPDMNSLQKLRWPQSRAGHTGLPGQESPAPGPLTCLLCLSPSMSLDRQSVFLGGDFNGVEVSIRFDFYSQHTHSLALHFGGTHG